MYTPGFFDAALFRRLGRAKEGDGSELGEFPDDGLIRRSSPKTRVVDGLEWLVSGPKIRVYPMAGKDRNQI